MSGHPTAQKTYFLRPVNHVIGEFEPDSDGVLPAPISSKSSKLLNRTNFRTVAGTNANSSGFGVFNATVPARQLQWRLKW